MKSNIFIAYFNENYANKLLWPVFDWSDNISTNTHFTFRIINRIGLDVLKILLKAL